MGNLTKQCSGYEWVEIQHQQTQNKVNGEAITASYSRMLNGFPLYKLRAPLMQLLHNCKPIGFIVLLRHAHNEGGGKL